MFLMIDNYDSFVYNLVRYFEELEEDIVVFRNDALTIEDIVKLNPEGIIISPGPKDPENSGICLEVIDFFKETKPILGVCLGHQVIGYYFGGAIEKGEIPMHGKISPVFHDGEGVFHHIANPVSVTRYHSLVVSKAKLPSCLKITAETEDGVVMGLRHNKFCIEGVQFHPEAELTEYGHKMLTNFIVQARKFNGVEK